MLPCGDGSMNGQKRQCGGGAALGENLQRKDLEARPSICGHERTLRKLTRRGSSRRKGPSRCVPVMTRAR